jgi:hypothetical protein
VDNKEDEYERNKRNGKRSQRTPRPLKKHEYFYFVHGVQTGSGTHTIVYPVANWAFFCSTKTVGA